MGTKPPQQDPPEPASGSAFAALAALRGTLPAGPEPQPLAAAATTRSAFAGRIVITRERKGRGGKTVTLVRGIALDGGALEELAREMRQALGSGGGTEGDAIILHGDQSARAAEWLAARGATRLARGN